MSIAIAAPAAQTDVPTPDPVIPLSPEDLRIIDLVKDLDWGPLGPLDTRRAYFKPAFQAGEHLSDDAYTLTVGYESLQANHSLLAFVLSRYVDDVPVCTDTREFIDFLAGIETELLVRCEQIVKIGMNHWKEVAWDEYRAQLKKARSAWTQRNQVDAA